MKTLIAVIFTSLGFSQAFAAPTQTGRNFSAQPSIQVTVNGRTFNCSGDLSDMNCYRAAETAKSKFSACRNAGYSSSSCFQNSFSTKIANCSNWADACNDSCKEAGFSATSCFQNCY